MHKNYFTLVALAKYFGEALADHRFIGSYSHLPGELVIVFLHEKGTTDLRVITGLQNGCLFLTSHSNPPKRNVMRFFPELEGGTLSAVNVADTDRTLSLHFAGGDVLHIRMFGAGGGNVLRCGSDGNVLDSFKHEPPARPQQSRDVKSWKEVLRDEESFRAALDRTSQSTEAALIGAIPPLRGVLAAEILHRARLDGSAMMSEIGVDGVARLFKQTAAVIDECVNSPKPVVYVDGAATFSLIPLETLATSPKLECKDVNDGIRRWIAEHGKSDGAQQERQRILHVINAYVSHVEKSIQHLREDLSERKEELAQRKGELLMAHMTEVTAGADSVVLEEVEIKLDAKKSVPLNASEYFDTAKRRKAARSQSERRMEKLAAALLAGKARQEAFAGVHTREELEIFVVQHHELLKQMEEQQANAPREHPYRSYKLSDECEVFVGKNAKQNDELTFHFAKQNDLWFHVRGAEGSHAILRYGRRESPPKEFILKAAAIAAFHSKAKSSKLVPVLYTQRKFVHKPRGAKPGTVIAQREEVVLVAPAVPAGTET